MQVPFVDLKIQYNFIKNEINKALEEVFESTTFIGGSFVNDFEKNFSEVYGVKHVIGTGNGTHALYIILKILGVRPGDEVITPALSWISSSETISQTGAKPVFVDIDKDARLSWSAK